MKPVFEYLDYRVYMREFYEERKRTSAFTWREFSKLSGFSSSGYLKLVCDGKTRLRSDGAKDVARAMGLPGFHAEYFCFMVKFCDAKTNEEKQQAYGEMQSLAEKNKVRVLGGDAYRYFSSWVNPVLRELAPIMPGATVFDMARKLSPYVPASEVRQSLERLVQMGLLKKNENADGVSYEQVNVGINPAYNPDHQAALNVAMRSTQKQFVKIAANALDTFDMSERCFAGMTVGLNQEAYRRLEKEFVDFRKKIESIVTEVKDYDRVFQINLQMFPLTRKLEEKNET